MPISFLQPILTFALVWANGWEKWNASYWDSLVVSAPLVAARCSQPDRRLQTTTRW